MRLRTLGALHLEGAVRAPGPRALFLLAYLAREGPKERRFLAELLWRGTTDARNRLSTALSRLRRVDPGLVRATPTIVGVDVATDLDDFDLAWHEGRYEDAVATYAGPFLAGFDPGGNLEVEAWLYEQREAAAGRMLRSLIGLGEREARRGASGAALRWAEQAHAQLADAAVDADTIERLATLLRAMQSPLAADVEREVVALGRAVGDGASARVRFQRTFSGAALPARPATFVGRTAEVERVVEMLGAHRGPVTLVGTGGVGKTRLALEVAWRLHEEGSFADGVAFVALASATRADQVVPLVAQACGVRETADGDVLEALVARMVDRSCLVILDNLEHLRAAGPDIARWLERCPGLRVLVTSRAPLRLVREVVVRVEPFEVPVDVTGRDLADVGQLPAVALFVARARAVDGSFVLDAATAYDVVDVCTATDGLPLAIELAAARIRLFSPAEMRRALGDRIDLLDGGPSDAEPRQRSLQATLDWSHALLCEEERRLFRRLSLFEAPFTLAAAEALAARGERSLHLLEGLVDQSLIRALPGAERRFALLATIREFGRARLEDHGERRHAESARLAYLLGLVERVAPAAWTGPEQGELFERFRGSYLDLRAALAFAAGDGDAAAGLRLAAGLWRFWVGQGLLREGRDQLERALGARGDAPVGADVAVDLRAAATRAEALEGLGTIHQQLGEPRRSRADLLEALDLWMRVGDERRVATTRNNLAWLALNLGDLDEAEREARTALAVHAEHGDARGRSVSLNNLGWIAIYRDDAERAIDLLGESLSFRRMAGDERGIAYAQANLAWAARLLARYEEAARLLEAAAATLLRLHDEQVFGWVRYHQAAVALATADVERAHAHASESVVLHGASANPSGEAMALALLADVLLARGRALEAATFARRAVDLARRVEEPWTQDLVGRTVARIERGG